MEGSHITHDIILTLTVAIFAGAMLTLLARKANVPTIVLLLAGGFMLGPEGLGFVRPDALQDVLPVIVSLAIGIILFEGGMTLDLKGYQEAGLIIRRVLTVGVLVTWLGTALIIRVIFDYNFAFCLLAGSLVIVTGPTVIQPLLKRIRLKRNLHNILHWEGVLIDPVGVFVAVLAFEWAVGSEGGLAFYNFISRFVVGLFIGYLGGELLCLFLKRKWIPDDAVNLFTLSGAVMIFGLAESMISEGGLLSVTIAGLVLGWRKPTEFKAILEFKSTLTDLLIGMLFILLTARLEPAQFADFGRGGMLAVFLLVFLIRPLGMFLCGWKTELTGREKVFLSWVAPRGIVAASISSLFALELARQGVAEARFLETFVYSVIITTIGLQGFTAAPLAILLRLRQPRPEGWLIVGAHPLARRTARFIRKHAEVPVALVDGNRTSVSEAKARGLKAFLADARDVKRLEGRAELAGIGKMIALTDNEDLNELLCDKWGALYGKANVYRWASGRSDMAEKEADSHGSIIWAGMPAPSFICGELLHGEAHMNTIESEEASLPEGSIPLVAVEGKKLLLDPDMESAPRPVLVLQREVDYLLGALRSGLVWQLDCADKESLLKAMCERFGEFNANLDADKLFADILEREKAYPTVLGEGVAIPHAHTGGIKEPLCAIAQLSAPVNFAEGEDVQIVFMLLSPLDMPDKHLAVLGEVARLMSDADARRNIAEAETCKDLLEYIREHRLRTLLNQ